VTARRFPFHDLKANFVAHEDELRAAIDRVVRSGWYLLGAELAAFESEYAAAIGVPHVVGVANATDALTLALRALDLPPGSHVAIPALTAIPTAMAVKALGFRTVLVDVDAATLTMCPRALRAALTAETRAIIPVHLYGQFAAIDELLAIADQHGIPLIEDAAQAHGATFDGKQAGNFGRVACYSFYPTKNLGALGDGGALATRDAALAERLKRLRFYGQVDGYDCVEVGQNSRLDELHAALLRVKLKYLAAENAQRRATAARYRAEISHPEVRLLGEAPRREHVYHQFVVRCSRRDALREHLKERGIDTLIHYPRALSQMAALRDDARLAPRPLEAERAAAELLSLPIYPEAPRAQIDATIAAIMAF
jgi:dTDP-4-amino-4,6-dideoxygalactose transaminase